MATPSSSATTPSPQLLYMQPNTAPPPATMQTNGEDAQLREEREKAVQKFLARAELSKLTRGLRARLSYASYKATHNLSHNTLRDLEVQTQDQTAFSRMSASRSAPNYYNNPATQGNNATTSSASRGVTRKGSMAPPPLTASASQSLFSSILAPPSAKRARTIHNPHDPPLLAPSKPKASTPMKKAIKSSRQTRSAQSEVKTRKDDKGKGKVASLNKAKSKERSSPRTSSRDTITDVDVDMKAAAALTSMFLSRPSMSMSASSPRSSISAGSDAGSTHSYSHYAQSSTRTTTGPTSANPSGDHSFAVPYPRSSTPPLSSSHSARMQGFPQSSSFRLHGNTTPKTQTRPPTNRFADPNTPHPPSDTEAADSLLFLATSPSPARPATTKDKDSQHGGAFRSLGGGSALKGRVLFAGSGPNTETSSAAKAAPLRRDFSSNYSSASSVATEPANDSGNLANSQENVIGIPLRSSPKERHSSGDNGGDGHPEIPEEPTVVPPTPTDIIANQLLQPPPSSPRTDAFRSGAHAGPSGSSSSSSASFDSQTSLQAPPTPGSVPFNLHDFINVSPSPATSAPAPRLSSSLRADMGRRLFEEHHGLSHTGRDNLPAQGSGLGAGIDLVNS